MKQRIASVTTMMFLVVCGVLSGLAQEKLRRVEQSKLYQYPNMPVSVDVKFDGREMVDRKVMADQNWLHKLSLDVTNTSAKEIKELRINLILAEGASLPNRTTVMISLDLTNAVERTETLLPGDRKTLKPPANWVNEWVAYLRDRGKVDLESIILDVRDFVFTDGTRWYMGIPMGLDPETGRYYRTPTGSGRHAASPPSSVKPVEN